MSVVHRCNYVVSDSRQRLNKSRAFIAIRASSGCRDRAGGALPLAAPVDSRSFKPKTRDVICHEGACTGSCNSKISASSIATGFAGLRVGGAVCSGVHFAFGAGAVDEVDAFGVAANELCHLALFADFDARDFGALERRFW